MVLTRAVCDWGGGGCVRHSRWLVAKTVDIKAMRQ